LGLFNHYKPSGVFLIVGRFYHKNVKPVSNVDLGIILQIPELVAGFIVVPQGSHAVAGDGKNDNVTNRGKLVNCSRPSN
jgi:hypothetical protein